MATPLPSLPAPVSYKLKRRRKERQFLTMEGTLLYKWKHPQPAEDGRVGESRWLPARPGSQAGVSTRESGGPCGSTRLRGLGVLPRGVWGSLVSCLAGPCPGVYLEVLDVFGAAELRQACRPHQGKEVEKEQPVAPQDGVGPFTVAPEPAVGGQGGGPGSSRPPAPQPAGQPALTLEGAVPTKPQRPLTDRPQCTPPGAPGTKGHLGGLRHPHLSNFSLLFVFPCWITWTKS